jgi:hypothetical protein
MLPFRDAVKVFLFGSGIFWCAGPAHAQLSAEASTDAALQVTAPVSIGVSQNLSFNALQQTVGTGLTITTSAANGLNANITLGGAGGSAVSLSVPASFSVTRDGGLETITVRTVGPVTNVAAVPGVGPTQVTGVVAGGIFSAPVTVSGTLDSGVLSFSVGGVVTVANNLTPGEYHGVLTVIAQYN